MLDALREGAAFRADGLSWVMATLIVFVVLNVLAYSRRYLDGDRNARGHRRDVALLGAAVLALAFADHLAVLVAAWAAANLLLVRLMMHNGRWEAARNSGLLALGTFAAGFAMLAAGTSLLAFEAGTASVRDIAAGAADPTATRSLGLALVGLAAMTQSAAWPFHLWLMSSLNAPTPVSALMHAGLINGGGFLLVRFAPLYATEPWLLRAIFLAGLITATVGTFWKLLQPDIKRMLACSTMGQMGFMLMQCGMGLFAPAVSHLCWHGLFKAYLFLNAGSAVREDRRGTSVAGVTPIGLIVASLAGVLGAVAFSRASGIGLRVSDTSCVMAALAFMAAARLAAGLLDGRLAGWKVVAAPLAGLLAGGLYGLNVRMVEALLPSLAAARPQALDGVYLAGLIVLSLAWLAATADLPSRLQSLAAWKRLYVAALNASQPHPRTITSTRTAYRY
ncbi:Na(+)/H(+) antiporter subunit A [Aquisphaera giovannonii]|uniref:Na(+)/H(+) antiporter subunit A n=1 Tax=Aquisphaera giovannonii TaxID=406548 RepID=A0A5B9W813_9BACT|nr:proton-conducting transporter membrane subunit [Aquisphaera giovannonii]QEH36703.1 Na(+)/H(+) antiporter subunit A [Aquisphaera giovannonii]